MTKYDWTDFFAWLDRATIAEIMASRDRAYELRRTLKDPDYRSDLRRMIRLMDQELLTRADLAHLAKRRASGNPAD
jgi:hypothetical protein